jgi:hypothetical protein
MLTAAQDSFEDPKRKAEMLPFCQTENGETRGHKANAQAKTYQAS